MEARVARGTPHISHFLFSDDTLIFGKATHVGATNLIEVLRLYASSSGQLINFAKYSVFFSVNVGASDRIEVGRILGVPIANN